MPLTPTSSRAAAGIAATILDAKGDLIAASAADTAARLAVGANGGQLLADSGQAAGLEWVVREELAAVWTESATKTNIGAAYVDVYTQANAEAKWIRIDTTGYTQYRVDVLWNKIGTGVQDVRVVEVAGVDVLHEFANLASGGTTSGLVALPAAFLDTVKQVKVQARSSVATDDPVFEGLRVFFV